MDEGSRAFVEAVELQLRKWSGLKRFAITVNEKVQWVTRAGRLAGKEKVSYIEPALDEFDWDQ